MEVILDGRKAKAKGETVEEVVASLGLNLEEVLVKINGKLAANREKIPPNAEVKIMKVIFGG
jgi:sulfur carrier protein ThiS